MTPRFLAVVFLLAAVSAQAAQPLPGYACMALNITEAQSRDPNFVVPVLASPGGPKLLNSATVVFVRQPSHVVRGYAEILTATGRSGWIARDILKPMRGHCTPMLRDDGRPEFGP